MLMCVCDLCGKTIGKTTAEEKRDQLRVTYGAGKIMFLGDVCETCYKRFCDYLNLPKDNE